MKHLIAIVLAAFAFTASAAEPAKQAASAPMLLAKKKADKGVEKKAATKSPVKDTKEPAKGNAK